MIPHPVCLFSLISHPISLFFHDNTSYLSFFVIVHAICFFFHDNTYYPSFCRPSKHFLLSKTSSRRLQDVFSVTLFVFQDLLKTYLQYVFLKCLQNVLQDVFKTFSRRLQDMFARRLAIMSSRRLQDDFKKSWKTKKCYTEDVFSTSSPRRILAGVIAHPISLFSMITHAICLFSVIPHPICLFSLISHPISLFSMITHAICLSSVIVQAICLFFHDNTYYLSFFRDSTYYLSFFHDKRLKSSRPDVFCNKSVLRNFSKFTGKHLCQRLFFNKIAGLRSATLLKKRLWHRCFPVNL